MNSSTILLAVHALLSDERKWTTGALARDLTGNPVEPLDPNAVSWSTPGACHYVSNDPSAFDQCKGYILAFSPGLGRRGEEITHQAAMSRIHGGYLAAYMLEGPRKK